MKNDFTVLFFNFDTRYTHAAKMVVVKQNTCNSRELYLLGKHKRGISGNKHFQFFKNKSDTSDISEEFVIGSPNILLGSDYCYELNI